MYLGGVFVCIDPLALRALPLYFAAQNTGESVRCISLSPLLRCYSKCPAMLRGTVGGRGLKSTNILNFSIAVPRSITGCGVSNRGGVTK